MSTLTIPQRVRITRTRDSEGKSWRDRHPDAVIVDRRTTFGNPFRVYLCDCCGHWDVIDNNGVSHHVDHAVARGEAKPTGIVLDPTPTPRGELQRRGAILHAVELFEQDIEWGSAAFTADQVRAELAGKDLACWCEPFPLPRRCPARPPRRSRSVRKRPGRVRVGVRALQRPRIRHR